MDEYYTFYISLWRVFNKGRSREKNDQEKKEKKRRDTMEIQKTAIAGTLESSDAQITVEPAENGIELTLDSSVMNQYGRQIREAVLNVLEELGVENGKVTVVDKGGLECTLKARVECAVFRSCDISEKNIPWGGIVR